VNDGKRERELQLVERLVVGRDPACDISLEDSLLSRRHAEFVAAGDVVTVRDLGSRNGIFVNGTRADEHVLAPGDVIQIGPLRVRYVKDRSAISLSGPSETLDLDATIRIPDRRPRTDRASAVVSTNGPALEDDDQTYLIGGHSGRRPDRPDTTRPEANLPALTPAPSAVGRPPAFQPPPVASAAVVPAVDRPARVDERALAVYVFTHLAALAGLVFACTSVPLLLWPVGKSAEGGSTLALVLWPVVPLSVALVAAYLVATLVNRRFQDVLRGVKRNTPQRF
jgi:hypothetical protein